MLSDTECEDLEDVFATNVFGPFRLTKALMGALAASAREGRGAVVLNVFERRRRERLSTAGALTVRAKPRLIN
jgi:NAD(P)-dependent dehydrogenase (short-subunit alcohol dehydrogenase family)